MVHTAFFLPSSYWRHLDHSELFHGDRNYHFLIHEPLGLHALLFLNIFGGSFPIQYVKLSATQVLRALEFVHSTQVVHLDGSDSFCQYTLSSNSPWTLDLPAHNILLRIDDRTVL